ncbi:hypothetical protein LV78_005390 [Actinosynnema pretiosum]|nr:hypothetical protein [Actinosynnema pretiosum]
MLPAAAGAHPALHGSFVLLRLPIEDDPGLVYLEDRLGGRYYQDAAEVAEYDHVLDHLRARSLNRADSSQKIHAIAEEIPA